MNIGRFFSWSMLAGMAIAGGLFVSDQRLVKPSGTSGSTIVTRSPLRLGVVLSTVPGTVKLNQAISHTLILVRNHVNQCGGVNQAPVFLAMDAVLDETTDPSDVLTRIGSKKPLTPSQAAIAHEAQAMNRLIQGQDIHGAIATLTPEPDSHGLTSKALDTAISFNIPTISPANPHPLLETYTSPFNRFRRELSRTAPHPSTSSYSEGSEQVETLSANAEDNGGKRDRISSIQAKKTKYWSRTMMSDRQYLMMVAQLAHQKGWQQIVTIGPNSERSAYLETLLAETVDAWSGTVMTDDQFLTYQVTPSDAPLLSAEALAANASPTEQSSSGSSLNSPPTDGLESSLMAIDVALNLDKLVVQQPDVIILFLEPGMFSDLSWPSLVQANLPEEALSDEALNNEDLNNEDLSNEALSNEDPSNEDLSNEALSNEILTNETLTNEILTNETLTNETLTDQTLSSTLPTEDEQLQQLSPHRSPPDKALNSILRTVPKNAFPHHPNPLPLVGHALMEQLRSVVNIEQTPIVVGNWLEVQLFLEQEAFMQTDANTQGAIGNVRTSGADQPPSSDSLFHPLTGLRGLLPIPTQSPDWFFQQAARINPPAGHQLLDSAIAPATWDAAALMMLAAEVSGDNHKEAIQENLHNVANPPGKEVTDVCEALELVRQGQSINYQGISGRVDLDGWGNVNPPQSYKLWEITPTGIEKTIDTLKWAEPSSSE